MMKKAKLSLLILLLVQPWSLSLAEIIKSHFYKVKVSKATLLTSRTLDAVEPYSRLTPFLPCASVCNLDPECQLWCHESLNRECLLSDMFVMPTYVETNMADALTCYTKRHKDLATGAYAEGSALSIDFPRRTVENLADGIYDRQNMLQCFMTGNSVYQPWFLLDFGEPVAFRVVTFFAQSTGAASFVRNIGEMEIRVGMVAVGSPGDFSSYDLIGSFPGPATEYDQEIFFEFPTPITARFLAVQKMMADTKFQVCHLEVY
ncbi:uncharacterized protein LOC122254892 [Penaeus japonicus]|uniref:uncharacterized protein LOC122254892 n=1 Tax=Penaeus japonicus TaxID=27405 RepID=UPI001C70F78E|nr:uncharacterized protein LOC122254892 [Penaeus japonicus]